MSTFINPNSQQRDVTIAPPAPRLVKRETVRPTNDTDDV